MVARAPKAVQAVRSIAGGYMEPDELPTLLAAYAANPLFRGATAAELLIEDNPYRRPVRPDDLSFVRFRHLVSRENASELSSLMANRLLLNIYDGRRRFLPEEMTEERRGDLERFYSNETLVLGEMVRPYLERHVFSFVIEEAAERYRGCSGRATSGEVGELAEQRFEAVNRLLKAAQAASAPIEAGRMVAVQRLALSLDWEPWLGPRTVARIPWLKLPQSAGAVEAGASEESLFALPS